jgi:hypothetical protein
MRLCQTKKCDRNERDREKGMEFDLTESMYSRLILNQLWERKKKKKLNWFSTESSVLDSIGLWVLWPYLVLWDSVGLADLSSSSLFVFAFFFFFLMYYHWLFHNDANEWCGPGFLHWEKDSNIFQSITFWIVKYIYLLYYEILSHHLENSLLCRRRNTIYF